MKKIKNKSGESLVETLLAIVIIMLAMLFLSTSIVTAQKINHAVKSSDVSFNYGKSGETDGQVSVKIGSSTETIDVTYYTDNEYVYYERNGESE